MKRFWDFSPILFGSLPVLIFLAIMWANGDIHEEPKPLDPERANFMLECVYGWGQTPENCEAILLGELPPPLPEYDEGC